MHQSGRFNALGSEAPVVKLIEDQAGRLAAEGSEASVGLERPYHSWFGGGEGKSE